jgi:hypothetical protein
MQMNRKELEAFAKEAAKDIEHIQCCYYYVYQGELVQE